MAAHAGPGIAEDGERRALCPLHANLAAANVGSEVSRL